MANFPFVNRVKLTYNMVEVIKMAEFCLERWNILNRTDDPEEAYVMSWDLELCEGCGEWKRGIVAKRRCYGLRLLLKKCISMD